MLAKEILYWHSCIRMTFSGVGMSQKKIESLRSIAVLAKLLSIAQS